uniref:GAT domain-containing protein n=1 Tax=Macrostomum lignano TaxID=282301 RepID=A0A1I8IY99_9PLAT
CRNEEALRSLEELDAVLRSHECLLTAPASSYSTPETRDGQAAMSTSVANSSAEISTSIYDVLSQSPQAASADSGLSGRNRLAAAAAKTPHATLR